MSDIGTMRVKSGLADMLKGGVIMDVTNAEQAKIAEDAGACAVMALERVPSDIRAQGGVARMADPTKIQEIQECGHHPGHGQGAHRPLRGGADPRGARGRLHRRERSAHAGRRGQPHQQVEVQRAVRLRRRQPRRGAAPHQRGRRHDPHQGRGRHRRRGGGRAPHAHHHGRDPPPADPGRGRALRGRQGAAGAPASWYAGSPRTASCRWSTSRPAASPLRPTPPS